MDDDESTGVIRITPPEIEEAAGARMNFNLHVSRTNTTERRLDVGTVDWKLVDMHSTATRGTDFTASSQTGTFNNLLFTNRNDNRTPTRTLTVTISDDEIPEGTELVALRLRKGNDGFHFPDADGDGYPEREVIVYGRIIDDEEGTTTLTVRPSTFKKEGDEIKFAVDASKQPVGSYPNYTNPRSTGVLHWELIPETAVFSPTGVDTPYQYGEDFKFKSVRATTSDADGERDAADRSTHTHTISNGRLTGTMNIVMPQGDIYETQEIVFDTYVDGLVEQTERFTVRFWLEDNTMGDLTFSDDDDGGRGEILFAAELQSKERLDVAVHQDLRVTEGEDVIVTMTLARALEAGESASLNLNAIQGGANRPCGAEIEMALAEVHYVPIQNRRVTWRQGEKTKQITITTIGDVLDNDDVCFQIVWWPEAGGLNVTGAYRTDTSAGTLFYSQVILEDDDDPPGLYAENAFVSEMDEGQMANLRFEVGLNSPSNKTITVSYALDTSNMATPSPDYPDAATAGEDFVAASASGTVTFEPGDVLKYVNVQVMGDYTEENNEFLRLKFTVMEDTAVILDGASELTRTGYIRNDDEELRLTITVDDYRVQEGEDAVYRLHLSQSISNYRLEVQTEAKDYSATAGPDYDASNLMFNVLSRQTGDDITIPTEEDGVEEGIEKFSITVSDIILKHNVDQGPQPAPRNTRNSSAPITIRPRSLRASRRRLLRS